MGYLRTCAAPIGFSILLASASAFPDAAGSRKLLDGSEALDHKAVHWHYGEGDFDAVIAAIEGFMQRNRSWIREDSIFIAKHLAVVHTANPATREKGRYYMHQLLELTPSAKLVDMFVSEEIDRIFEKVREEYHARRRSLGADTAPAAAAVAPAASSAAPAAPAAPSAGPSKRGRGHAGFWIAGGAAVAAAGLAAVYLLHESETRQTYYKVPGTLK